MAPAASADAVCSVWQTLADHNGAARRVGTPPNACSDPVTGAPDESQQPPCTTCLPSAVQSSRCEWWYLGKAPSIGGCQALQADGLPGGEYCQTITVRGPVGCHFTPTIACCQSVPSAAAPRSIDATDVFAAARYPVVWPAEGRRCIRRRLLLWIWNGMDCARLQAAWHRLCRVPPVRQQLGLAHAVGVGPARVAVCRGGYGRG